MYGPHPPANVASFYRDFTEHAYNTLTDIFEITTGTGGSAVIDETDAEGAGGKLRLTSTTGAAADVAVKLTRRLWRPSLMGPITARGLVKISAFRLGLFMGFADADPSSGAMPISNESGATALTTPHSDAVGLMLDEQSTSAQAAHWKAVATIGSADKPKIDIPRFNGLAVETDEYMNLMVQLYPDGRVMMSVGEAGDTEGGRFGLQKPLEGWVDPDRVYGFIIAQEGRSQAVNSYWDKVECFADGVKRGT